MALIKVINFLIILNVESKKKIEDSNQNSPCLMSQVKIAYIIIWLVLNLFNSLPVVICLWPSEQKVQIHQIHYNSHNLFSLSFGYFRLTLLFYVIMYIFHPMFGVFNKYNFIYILVSFILYKPCIIVGLKSPFSVNKCIL